MQAATHVHKPQPTYIGRDPRTQAEGLFGHFISKNRFFFPFKRLYFLFYHSSSQLNIWLGSKLVLGLRILTSLRNGARVVRGTIYGVYKTYINLSQFSTFVDRFKAKLTLEPTVANSIQVLYSKVQISSFFFFSHWNPSFHTQYIPLSSIAQIWKLSPLILLILFLDRRESGKSEKGSREERKEIFFSVFFRVFLWVLFWVDLELDLWWVFRWI